MGKRFNVTTIDGKTVRILGSADIKIGSEILEYQVIPILDSDKVERHSILSTGFTLPTQQVERLIVTLEKCGYGHGGVYIHTDPHFGKIDIYDSHPDLGSNIPTEAHIHKATEVYHDILSMIRKGNFKVHLFSHGVIGLEERVQ